MFDREGNRKYLNTTEREVFRKFVSRLSDPSEKTFCLTLLHTGCRISEALNLPCGCLDASERTLIFETLKRRQKGLFRAVPIPNELVRDLKKLTHGKAPDVVIWDFSRITAWRVVKQTMLKAKMSGIRACPKGLRHGFAIACVSKKIPLTTVQKWMGHARLETTAIYLNFMGGEERNLARRLWKNKT